MLVDDDALILIDDESKAHDHKLKLFYETPSALYYKKGGLQVKRHADWVGVT